MPDGHMIHGDCFDVLPTLAPGSVDMVFCDLPYAHRTASGQLRKCTRNTWDTPIDLSVLWPRMLNVGKSNCVYIFTASQPFSSHIVASRPGLFRYDLVWKKLTATGFLNANRQPLRAHEHVLVFSQRQTVYNAQKTQGLPYNAKRGSHSKNYDAAELTATICKDGMRYPTSVLEFWVKEGKSHPTQKPLDMLAWLIKTYTHEGDTVLDPTAGSGTTAVAAINTGRKYICIERDATYHAAATRRIAEAQAAPQQQAMAL